jgi:hypothetical protein
VLFQNTPNPLPDGLSVPPRVAGVISRSRVV